MFFQQLLFNRHLDENEKLYFIGHKHWIEIIKSLIKFSLFGLVAPWGLYVFTGALPILWIAIICTILVYVRLMYILIDWYFDAVLITSESLLFVEWHGFFHRESSRITYESVESINIEMKGALSLFLGYGVISIERDAAPSIEMKNMNNPKRLELEIKKGKEKYTDKETGENAEALNELLSHLIGEHIKKYGWKWTKK